MEKKRQQHPNSLANLQPPFYGNDDPRAQKAHSPEANKKRNESRKKTFEEKKRRNKLREDMLYVLSLPLDEQSKYIDDISKIKDFKSFGEIEGSTAQDKLIRSMFIEAFGGNVKAAEFIRDVIGEKAPEVVETRTTTAGQSTMKLLIEKGKKNPINNNIKKDDN